MLYENIKNNYAEVSGVIESGFEFSHTIRGERFYSVRVRSNRLSDACDLVPLLFSEKIIDVNQSYIGQQISVNGQFRSFNRHINDHSHLILYLYVRAYAFSDEELTQSNMIYLNGYLCKEPVFRTTPKGKDICELIVAVNREYKKTDYIPCICWGRDARFACTLGVGSHIRLWGRIQSRKYRKKLDDQKYVIRETYEVSINTLEELETVGFRYGKVAEGRSYYYENTARQRNQ